MTQKNLQKGFSIIEFVISMLISTILMTAALAIYQQVSSGSRKIQTVTTQDLSVMILEKRLTDDLMGLSALWFTKDTLTKTAQPKNNNASSEKNISASAQPEKTTDKNIEKNNFFYAQTQNNQIDFMTFISTSTLHSFTKPRLAIARIVYSLIPDPAKPNLFMLQRKEEAQISDEINIEKIKQGTFYTLMQNIKNCSLEYGFIDMSPEKRTEHPDQEWKMKWVKQWGKKEEEEKTKDTDKDNYTPQLPDVVKIKIQIQEFTDGPIFEHEFSCIVPSSKETTISSIAQKRKQQEISSQQSNLSNASNIMQNVQNSKAASLAKNSSPFIRK